MIAWFDPMYQRGISLTFGGLMRIIADLNYTVYVVRPNSGV